MFWHSNTIILGTATTTTTSTTGHNTHTQFTRLERGFLGTHAVSDVCGAHSRKSGAKPRRILFVVFAITTINLKCLAFWSPRLLKAPQSLLMYGTAFGGGLWGRDAHVG